VRPPDSAGAPDRNPGPNEPCLSNPTRQQCWLHLLSFSKNKMAAYFIVGADEKEREGATCGWGSKRVNIKVRLEKKRRKKNHFVACCEFGCGFRRAH